MAKHVRMLGAVWVLAALLLAGCTGALLENSVAVTKQLATSSTSGETRELDCDDGEGRLSAGLQIGQGRLTVQVTDGAGKQLFSNSYQGASQSGEDQTLSGAAGEWTLLVEAIPEEPDYGGSGRYGGDRYFSGQVAITLYC